MKALEEDVLSLLKKAQREVLVVAPFIRSESLKRLLCSVSNRVDTKVVTRWKIADLLSGSSDLGVFELVSSRNIPLFLKQDLHAKLFAADDKCLVGSANVTNPALGNCKNPNFELLVPYPRKSDQIVEFEKRLMEGVIKATPIHRDLLNKLLVKNSAIQTNRAVMDIVNLDFISSDWIPQSRNPEELYSVYRGNTDFGRTVLTIMKNELNTFDFIEGLNEDEFNVWIAIKLRQSRFVGMVLQQIEKYGPITESDLTEILLEMDVAIKERSPRDILEVLKRWLTYFLSNEYETVSDSIKLIKSNKL